MCCDTCYLWIPACPGSPRHPRVCSFQGADAPPKLTNVVHNQVPVLKKLPPFSSPILRPLHYQNSSSKKEGGLFTQIFAHGAQLESNAL